MGSRSAPTQNLQADWATIWQSELSALSTDREALEAAARTGAAWSARRSAFDRTARLAGTAAPPGPAPARDASDVAALERRIAELERRLART